MNDVEQLERKLTTAQWVRVASHCDIEALDGHTVVTEQGRDSL